MDTEVKSRKSRGKPREHPKPPAKSSFWEDKTVEQLAKEQGVKPIKDISQLHGYWPEDADDAEFEAFLEAVRGARE